MRRPATTENGAGARALLRRRIELGRLRRALDELETRHHEGRRPAGVAPFVPTGFAELDEALGGGWRAGALNEVVVADGGSGALEALLPALAHARANAPRLLAWIDPARIPYPPALAQAGFDLARWLVVRPDRGRDHAWALDLALRSGACDAVVAWLPKSGIGDDAALRRLQLAAEATGTLALFFRPPGCAQQPSPAAVRLRATPRASPSPARRRLEVELLRCRGQTHSSILPLVLEWSRDPLDEPPAAALRARAPAARLPADGDDDRRFRGVARRALGA
jgi:protein ImuA